MPAKEKAKLSLTRMWKKDPVQRGAIYYIRKKRSLEGFIENGGRFNPEAKNYWDANEAMFIAEHIGVEGLKIFVENGGQFNPKARGYDNWTEAMFIARYADTEGLKIFVENGGQFNPEEKESRKGQTEYDFVMKAKTKQKQEQEMIDHACQLTESQTDTPPAPPSPTIKEAPHAN